MNKERKYKSFWSFYPFYLTEHSDKLNRNLHFIGTSLVILLFLKFLLSFNWIYFALIPLAGYGFAWFGHFVIEKNRPATFQYPLYSLGSDFVMFWHIISGQLDEQIKKAKEIKENEN